MFACLGPLTHISVQSAPSQCAWKHARRHSYRWAHTSAVAAAHDVHNAFDVIADEYISEFACNAVLYRHKVSGAQVMSVRKEDDTNKVFGVTFRTPVDNSAGIPHILEHSVLCGSRDYPTKEPFVELLKGSLQTFLNAFTYPDRTCYPVASQNTKDFYNLVDVYMDAVFHPRAMHSPSVLAQEGWHLEQSDPDAPLTYKGVVYNEMKGVYSQPGSLLHRLTMASLFPDTTYFHDSGGDPADIPTLTFPQFQAYHATHYHPSNAHIWFYGDDDPTKRLSLVHERLSSPPPAPSPAPADVQWQPAVSEPTVVHGTYPAEASQSEPKLYASLNWVLNHEPLSEADQLALVVLNHILLGSTAAVLRNALLESRLGESLVGGGLSGDLLQHTFHVGLKGMQYDPADASLPVPAVVAELEALVMGTLRGLVDEGINADAIEASMNQVEFDMREFNVGGFPKGLALMLNAMRPWLYGESPFDGLRFEGPLKELKDALARGDKVFEGLIENLILSNQHRATVVLAPDVAMEARLAEEEQQGLAAIAEGMDTDALKRVRDDADALRASQSAEDPPEAKATIPRLSLHDLDRKARSIPVDIETRPDGVRVLTHDLSTSGILYAEVGFDAAAVPLAELPILALLTRMVTDVGTDKHDRVAFDRLINSRTGGVGCSLVLPEPARQDGQGRLVAGRADELLPMVMFSGKAVAGRAEDLFTIYRMCMVEANLDQRTRVVEMLSESKARLESMVVSSGNSVASMRIGAALSLGGFVRESLRGLPALDTIKQLLAEAETEEGWARLLSRLEGVRDLVFSTTRSGVVINLTGSQEDVLQVARPHVDAFLSGLPLASDAVTSRVPEWAAEWRAMAAAGSGAHGDGLVREGLVVPTQVNYVAAAGRMYDKGEVLSGSVAVIQGHLQTGHLWEQVRVMGGAYGASCGLSAASGTMKLVSYRDPNLNETLDAYKAAGKSLVDLAERMEEEELVDAIIGTIGSMDSPMSNDQKGYDSMLQVLRGQTFESDQRWRDEVLATTREDFAEFGKRLSKALEGPTHIAVVGSQAALDGAAAKELGLKTRVVLAD